MRRLRKPERSAESDAAAAAKLVYTTDTAPGIRRRRSGRGFTYLDADGNKLTDRATLARIRALAIPPAYEDVWICIESDGHLQATGRDARGRKQYRYHAAWRSLRDRDKFGRMRDFGERLPALRRRMRRDLKSPGLLRDKVLALAISLLDATLMRVGNREYLRSNGSYGLTTLRARHAVFPRNGRVRLHFRGKSGRMHELTVDDGRLVRLLRRCQRLPGQSLFQYLDDEGGHQPIDSGMINDYLHNAMGEDFTAKDFRTWGATRLAAAVLAGAPPPREDDSEHDVAATIARAVEQVAGTLGNTPAVCRASYIHPDVIAAWRAGHVIGVSGDDAHDTRRAEKNLLRLLKAQARRSTRRRPSGR